MKQIVPLCCRKSQPDESRLTLLASCSPLAAPGWGLLGGRFGSRGHVLDGPGLFGGQPLEADVALLKHLLDVLQALQRLQHTGLQTHRSLLSLLFLAPGLSPTSSSPSCPQTGQLHTGYGGSSARSAGSFPPTRGIAQCQPTPTPPLPGIDTYPQLEKLADKYQTRTTGSPAYRRICGNRRHRHKVKEEGDEALYILLAQEK